MNERILGLRRRVPIAIKGIEIERDDDGMLMDNAKSVDNSKNVNDNVNNVNSGIRNMEKLEEDRMKEKEMQNEEEEDVIEVRIEIAEMCVVEEVLGKDDIALH
ncbi:hypothetical protein Tco_0712645 [Tanacetum coccineum]